MKTLACAVSLASLLLVAGCSATAPRYTKADLTTQQSERDRFECERDARSVPTGDCVQLDLYQRCMVGRGYTAVPGTGSKGMCF